MAKFKLLIYAFVLFLFVLFFIDGPDYYSSRSLRLFWNFGHIIFFAFVTGLLLRQWRYLAEKNWVIQFVSVMLLCLIAGAIIELLQYGVGRELDFEDIFRDVIGGLAGFLLFSPVRKSIQKYFLVSAQAILLLLILLQLFPLVLALYDEWLASHQFPLLAGFETGTELGRWQGSAGFNISEHIAASGKASLQVQLGTETYSGVSLSHFPENWQGYRYFLFSVYSPDEKPLEIVCRIHDARHTQGEQLFEDRFNRRFLLHQGWNDFSVDIDDIVNAPIARKLSLQHIRGIGFFVVRQKEAKTIYLDNIRLE